MDTNYKPSDIRIDNSVLSVESLLKRINGGGINLNPDFQREGDLWAKKKMSLFIESLLLGVRPPTLYFNEFEENRWEVVDGLQRLSSLKSFVSSSFKFSGSGFFPDLEGKKFIEFPELYKLRLLESQLNLQVLLSGTPDTVKILIFSRLNSGGIPLNKQELRAALNQGPATAILKEIADIPDVKNLLKINDKRMGLREFIMRIFLLSIKENREKELGRTMDGGLGQLNKILNIEEMKERFLIALEWVPRLSSDHSSLLMIHGEKRINRALSDAVLSNFMCIDSSDFDYILSKKEKWLEGISKLMDDESFFDSITSSTNQGSKVNLRISMIEKLIWDILSEKQDEE